MEAVGAEDGFEAAFIEAGVVGHEGDIGGETVGFKGGQDAVFYLVPYVREEWGILCVVGAEAVDLLAEPGVVVRVRMNETVEGVHHFPIAHDNDAHGADAAGAAVGGFEINTIKAIQSAHFLPRSTMNSCGISSCMTNVRTFNLDNNF